MWLQGNYFVCFSEVEIVHYLKIRIEKEVWKEGNKKKDLQGKFEIAFGVNTVLKKAGIITCPLIFVVINLKDQWGFVFLFHHVELPEYWCSH